MGMSQGSGYKKVAHDRRHDRKGPSLRKFFDASGGVTCKTCFETRNKNQELYAEIVSLKSQLKTALGRGSKIHVGEHTPSSRIDFKKNSKEESRLKRGGGEAGHVGSGRKAADIATLFPSN